MRGLTPKLKFPAPLYLSCNFFHANFTYRNCNSLSLERVLEVVYKNLKFLKTKMFEVIRLDYVIPHSHRMNTKKPI